MSKLSKFIKKPHIFFRDYLLKRYPIGFGGQLGGVVDVMKCPFPIDVVYTWVDSSDESFVLELSKYIDKSESVNKSAKSAARWFNHDELKYSLRSLEKYAPWVNAIYVVTNGQRPSWLKEEGKIKLVSHSDILDDEFLPTFNSHVIGSALHRIPGLSEHYIYFNDDIFLLRDAFPEDFFSPNGLAYSFVSDNYIGSGPPTEHDNSTVVAAKNSRDLIFRESSCMFDRRMAHMYHPQRKSVAEMCDRLFASELNKFRLNKFRHADDFLCASFLYPYVGYLEAKVMFRRVKGWYVKIREKGAIDKFRLIKDQIGDASGRPVLCANDYIPAKFNFHDYGENFYWFLEGVFPEPSSFEI